MCGRYTIYTTEELGKRYGVTVPDDMKPNFNAAPSQTLPVITESGLEMMRWGLIPVWAKDEKIGYKLINARSETVFEKPMWKSIITKRRCLIPANGFYEWQIRSDGKQPYYIHLKKTQLFSFAGIWSSWKHENETWGTYSILTTSPNKDMSPIHDRMPVILHREDESQWLSAHTKEDIEPLLLPYEDHELDMYEVGKGVNVTAVNNEALIAPLNSK